MATRKHRCIESHNEAASIWVSGRTVNAAKRSLGGLSLRRFLQWFLSTFGQEHMASDRWIGMTGRTEGSIVAVGVIFHGNHSHKKDRTFYCLTKYCYTGCFPNRGTIRKEIIPYVKVGQKYRTNYFHMQLRFRENWVWIFLKYTCTRLILYMDCVYDM